MVEEALNPITLFIPAEKNEALICRGWSEEIRERRYIPTLNSMKEIVEFLMREGETIFIDELQNALKVNPPYFMILKGSSTSTAMPNCCPKKPKLWEISGGFI